MAEGSYEYELERSELLGIEPISRELWEAQEKARREKEQEDLDNAIAEEIVEEGEKVRGAHGKMDELNSILSVTQQKINKFRNVCGSLTSLLKIRTGSPVPKDPNSDPEKNGECSNLNKEKNTINDALEALDDMKTTNEQTDIQFAKKRAMDLNQGVSKNFDALDRLIDKAENAQYTLSSQNRQMKGLLK